jgi:hypothetical protein
MNTLILVPLSIASLLANGPASPDVGHRARVAGALEAVLNGGATFGPVRGMGGACLSASCAPAFSLELGTNSREGSVVFSRIRGDRPLKGTYRVTLLQPGVEPADELHALIALGPVGRPSGVFRAVRGTVTITLSTERRIAGRYELRAVGFLAADPDNETREITVRGEFSAGSSELPAAFEAVIEGAENVTAGGSAEFGEAGAPAERVFSLSLGAQAAQGSVLLSRAGAHRPEVGTYEVGETAEAAGGFHGLVMTGPPGRPTGVYRVRQGTLTITESRPDRIAGAFDLRARGFLASAIDDESREITTRGTFSAVAGTAPVLTQR